MDNTFPMVLLTRMRGRATHSLKIGNYWKTKTLLLVYQIVGGACPIFSALYFEALTNSSMKEGNTFSLHYINYDILPILITCLLSTEILAVIYILAGPTD